MLTLVLVVFLAAHTAGEVLYSAGTMELLFRLSPAQRQGQYGACCGISNGLMYSAAPAVLGAAIALSGGWMVGCSPERRSSWRFSSTP